MSKGKGFFSKLKRSTIITMVSCISFVVMTFLALLFFVKFPVTPSEKFTAGLGRESVYRQNSAEGLELTTTAETSSATTTVQTTTSSATEKTDFKITITTGKGFHTGGHTLTISENNDEDYDFQDSTETKTEEDSENSDYSNYDDEYGTDE